MSAPEDKVVLVTGAAGAVGSAVVRSIVAAGGSVIATDRDLSRLNAVTEPLAESSCEVAVLDVTSESAWKSIERQIVASGRQLGGAVSCAAIMNKDDGDVESVDPNVWARTLAVNLNGVSMASKLAVRLMKQAGGGSIVHTGSIVAKLGSANSQVAYTASKGAVLALSREMAVTHARDGIRVNMVTPGILETPMTMHLIDDDHARHQRLMHIPMGRFGMPEDIADAVCWLLSDASRYVTGTEIVVDGGLSAAFVTGHE